MAKLEIIVEGYVENVAGIERASSTVVLVHERDLNIIVDPGIARQPLAEALTKRGLKAEDIQYVFLTHYHPDHAFGAAWFSTAKTVDYEYLYDGDRIVKHDGFLPGTELAIVHTPGHSPEHCSLVVPTNQGMVVIAGDVFWWSRDQEPTLEVERRDPYATDHRALVESRSKILKLADFIVPGHGKIIKVR